MIHKALEAICDHCGASILYTRSNTVPETRKRVKDLGHLICKDKCFCDQGCCDKWWISKTKGILDQYKEEL
jgi:hypothetical protein